MEETAVGVVPLLRQSRTALSSDLRHIYGIIYARAKLLCLEKAAVGAPRLLPQSGNASFSDLCADL